MKPGGKGDMQTRIKGKTFTMEEFNLDEDTKTDLQIRASKGDKGAMEKLKKLRAAGKIGKEAGFEPGAKKDIPDMRKIEGLDEDNKIVPGPHSSEHEFKKEKDSRTKKAFAMSDEDMKKAKAQRAAMEKKAAEKSKKDSLEKSYKKDSAEPAGASSDYYAKQRKNLERTFTKEEVDAIMSHLEENYGDNTNDPKKLEKDLPKGYKYGTPRQGKGDHKTSALEVDGTETDMKIGGAAKGKAGSFSPSWKAEHSKVKKTLKGIDKAVSEVQKSSKGSNDTLKRMAKAHASRAKTAASKAISDMTGVGRKTNVQGSGNKALKRAGLREFAEALGMDTDVHPVDADRRGVDAGLAAGYDAVDAHQGIAGTTQLDSPDSLGKLAATMGRVQRDGGNNSPVPDKKGPKSLYAQEREQEKSQQTAETE